MLRSTCDNQKAGVYQCFVIWIVFLHVSLDVVVGSTCVLPTEVQFQCDGFVEV